MSAARYRRSVFLNCPFDTSYRPLFEALVFTIQYTGWIARCALEIDDSAEFRLEKVFRIISECRLGIHDISRAELDPSTSLPRFNMPLELGIFLGCKRFGEVVQNQKACLILDREPYRYRTFLSDLSGQDIHAHRDEPRVLIHEVRSWLRSATGRSQLPGGEEIWTRYGRFRVGLPRIAAQAKLLPGELTFSDYSSAVRRWIKG